MDRTSHSAALFANRTQAGCRLAAALLECHLTPPFTVLALPRGGVPVAAEVARVLHAPLDLVLVRKIGMPGQPELAVAAIVDGNPPCMVVEDRLWHSAGLLDEDLEQQTQQALLEIARRHQAYLQGRAPLPLEGRTAIVVDDGIATGTTMRAALKAVRARHPARVVLAVPLAPTDSLELLRGEVDQVVCLEQPALFQAVGQHYADFDQVDDHGVLDALASVGSSASR